MEEKKETYEAIKARLDEIVDAVHDDELSLDDALVLYEEAVKLGTRTTALIEEDIRINEVAAEEPEEGEVDGAEAEAGEAEAPEAAEPAPAEDGE